RPSAAAVNRFLAASQALPLSYDPVGIATQTAPPGRLDEATVVVGHGDEDFERARSALVEWKQFALGWVELRPRDAPIAIGTVVAVQVRHVGFWSLNGCRVVYGTGDRRDGDRFGYAYGTLPNHAEAGEELFEVRIDPRSGEVTYHIRAVSWPRAALARLG